MQVRETADQDPEQQIEHQVLELVCRQRLHREVDRAPGQQARHPDRRGTGPKGGQRYSQIDALEHRLHRVSRTAERRIEHGGDTGPASGRDQQVGVRRAQSQQAAGESPDRTAHLDRWSLGAERHPRRHGQTRAAEIDGQGADRRGGLPRRVRKQCRGRLRGIRRKTMGQPGGAARAQHADNRRREPAGNGVAEGEIDHGQARPVHLAQRADKQGAQHADEHAGQERCDGEAHGAPSVRHDSPALRRRKRSALVLLLSCPSRSSFPAYPSPRPPRPPRSLPPARSRGTSA